MTIVTLVVFALAKTIHLLLSSYSRHSDTLLDEMVSLGMLELSLKGVIYTALTQKHMHPPPSRSRWSSVDESAVAEPPTRSPSIVAKQPVSVCVCIYMLCTSSPFHPYFS